jgi:hypothetical protein
MSTDLERPGGEHRSAAAYRAGKAKRRWQACWCTAIHVWRVQGVQHRNEISLRPIYACRCHGLDAGCKVRSPETLPAPPQALAYPRMST